MITCLFTVSGRPGLFDLAGKQKWDAWETKKGSYLSYYYSYGEIQYSTAWDYMTYYLLHDINIVLMSVSCKRFPVLTMFLL